MDEFLFGDFEQDFTGSDSLSSLSRIAELQKSLSTGYEVDPANQTGFGAIRHESLDRTLKAMVPKTQDAKFYHEMKKGKADSTVEEFALINELGHASFYSEGGIPEEYDEDLSRELERVKYVGTVGKVPIPATKVNAIAGAIDTVTRLKAAAIIRAINVGMLFSDEDKNPMAWNGYIKQFLSRVKEPTQNVIDMRGKRLRPEDLNHGGLVIAENYGNSANLKLWMGNQAFTDYTDELLQGKRFVVGTSEARDIVARAKHFELGNGEGNIETDIFFRHKGETYLDSRHPAANKTKTAFVATSAKAPATLDGGSCTAVVADNAASLLEVGTYDYAVVAVNKYGASAAYELQVAVAAVSKQVTFTIADNSSVSGQEATSFEVYRKLSSESGLTNYKFLASFKASGVTIKDDGEHVPGTTYSMMLDWDFDQVISFKHLLPMVKMPLATIDDSVRWLQKSYGVPLLFNPNKMVLFKNVGSTPHS